MQSHSSFGQLIPLRLRVAADHSSFKVNRRSHRPKNFLSTVIFFVLFLAPAIAFANNYTTTFPSAQNPVSEGGNWLNGAQNGLLWGNVQSTAGLAFGTVISGAPPFNDSTAVLAGTWAQNQTAQATVHLANGNDSSSQEEVELHLNTTITPNSITGYEFDASVDSNNPYLVIVRWNGPQNSFCYISTGSTCATPRVYPVVIHDGDVLKATNVNGTLTFYVNGVAQVTATDSTYKAGAPGIGFWNVGGSASDLSHYGFSSFSATDGQAGSSAPTPTSLTCSPSSLNPSSTASCTVTLNQAAPSGGAFVGLSSSNSALTVPASVTVASSATSASFTATSGNFTTSQSATISASSGGSSVSTSINLVASQGTPAPATISYVQGINATPQSPTSTVTATYQSAQLAGDLNVVVVGWNDSTAVVKSVTDSKGNVYLLAVGPTVQKGTATQSVYFAKNIATATANSNIVTVRFSANARYADIRILEYKGVDPNNPLDVATTATGRSSVSAGSATTTGANDLVLAANLVQTVSGGPGAGFTQRMLTYDGDIVEDRITSAAGTYNATSAVYPSAQWIMQMVAFRAASTQSGTGTQVVPSSLSCAVTSMTGAGSDTCTVTLSGPAPTGGLTLSLGSNNSAVAVPATLSVAANASGASFTANIAQVTTTQTVVVTASAGGVIKSASIQLNAPASLGALSCSSSSITGAGTDSCTITLTAPAPAGGFAVALASNSTSLAVPASVVVPANAISFVFSAAAAAVSSTQAATLTATAAGISRSFAIQLNACVAQLTVNASTVSFGNVTLNQVATQSIVLSSTGGAAVTVSSISLSGTGFALVGATSPLTINPGQTATLNLQFDPSTKGAVSGQLTIVSNSTTGTTNQVVLSGTGVLYQVGLTWNAPVSTSDPVVGYRIYRSLTGASNYQLLNAAAVTQTAYQDDTIQSGSSYDYVVKSVDSEGLESPASNAFSIAVP